MGIRCPKCGEYFTGNDYVAMDILYGFLHLKCHGKSKTDIPTKAIGRFKELAARYGIFDPITEDFFMDGEDNPELELV